MEQIRPMLAELHSAFQRAQQDMEVNEILRTTGVLAFTGPRTELIDRTTWRNAKYQIEDLDRKRATGNHIPIAEQDAGSQPDQRRKLRPSGPKI